MPDAIVETGRAVAVALKETVADELAAGGVDVVRSLVPHATKAAMTATNAVQPRSPIPLGPLVMCRLALFAQMEWRRSTRPFRLGWARGDGNRSRCRFDAQNDRRTCRYHG